MNPKIKAAVAAESLILSPASPSKSALKYLELCCAERRLIRYRGEFYYWTGAHYQEWPDEAMRASVHKFLDAARLRVMAKSKDDWDQPERDTTVPFNPKLSHVNEVVAALHSHSIVEDRIEAAGWIPLPDSGGILDMIYAPGDLMACRNGLLHLPTRQMVAHTPEFLTFNSLPYDFDPNAAEPAEWLSFLGSIWPDDPESIATLQEIFGYLLSNDLSQQKMFMLLGPKRGGKGTIARVLRRLLGESGHAGPTLRSLSENFGLASLIGKRLAIIGDARIGGGADQNIVVERLLSISGEDAITVPRKFREDWIGKLGVRVLLLSNELPRFTDASATIASRFVILRLTQSFYGREDHGIESRIVRELPGILTWALAGLDRLTRRGYFVTPAAALATVNEMEELSSPLLAFVRDRCEIGSDLTVPVADLFQAWTVWCSSRNLPAGSTITFSAQLHAAVASVRTARARTAAGRGRVFAGIGLSASSWAA